MIVYGPLVLKVSLTESYCQPGFGKMYRVTNVFLPESGRSFKVTAAIKKGNSPGRLGMRKAKLQLTPTPSLEKLSFIQTPL